ncbi:aldehyde dehydrogenase family protein [Actinocrinis puniceicyclus]|uniref:Aldehyde dehydrogenase family protein n=1 Tax=Actinocrinis puniceicyclus TaxID=977794 RepID=A0A8J8BCG8_9ACTN|nr:aldehyde dehydrogenase family protein [Actinocrinis puniceicyclus]MBS2961764.1 aldehyde dehydrogenase family protein [Actinocrinis puniceicyclus]
MSDKARGKTAPAAKQAAARKSASKQSAAKQSAAKRTAAKQSAAKPPAEKIAAEHDTRPATVSAQEARRAETSAAVAETPPSTSPPEEDGTPPRPRLAVRKTYKLYLGGAFPRSESGRSYEVTSAQGAFLANAALASRKDARDAVKAARSAFGGWSGATAYNRGQILYRIAEMLEGRRDQFAAEIAAVEGVTQASALAQAEAAIDRWVWYAGWADKISQVRGTVNPVAGPYWNVSSPEPTGVVAVFAPERPSLFGLVSVLAPVIVSGNTAVVAAPGAAALPAITLAEVLATSDLPGGVVNILTGRIAELAPPLAAHLDVNALDLAGVEDPGLAAELERAAAQNLKRVRRPEPEPDWTADPGLDRIVSFLETKTVWHPVGV